MLITGTNLTPAQRELVLAAFVHRHTNENARQSYGGKCPNCEQSTRNGTITTGSTRGPIALKTWTRAAWHAYHAPLITDEQWLARHAFHFTADGRRLHARRGAVSQ